MSDPIMEYLNDFDLRELQLEAALVISNNNATNNWIKQFRAEHDSQQFYKNVIAWYIKENGDLPSVLIDMG